MPRKKKIIAAQKNNWKTQIFFGVFVFVVLSLSLYLNYSDSTLFKADITLQDSDVCAYTQPGGYIEQGTALSNLNGLPSLGSGPQDQFGILAYEVDSGGVDTPPNPELYPTYQSWVKENAELPASADTIELVFLAANTGFTPTATINGDVQIVSGIKRGVTDATGQPTGTIMSLNSPITADADGTNLTLYLRRDITSAATGCAMAIFKINTGYTATISGNVTDPEGPVQGATVTLSPCPTNSAGLGVTATASENDCTTTSGAGGSYTFANLLAMTEPYSVSATPIMPAGTTGGDTPDGATDDTGDTCSDGTPLNTCSSTQPAFCTSNGTFIFDCEQCGCPSGQTCNTATQECDEATAPTECSDGTPLDTCSSTQPAFCTSNGTFIFDCEQCGCPSGQTCNATTQECE